MPKPALIRNPQLDGTAFSWDAGPTGVLLIHGFTATTAEVRLLAQSLHEQGYTIAAPLLPGHDTSPEDCNRHTWQEWLDTCERAYQDLSARCQRVVIGGESAGALLVLRLAASHPEAAAVLCYAPALKTRISRGKVIFLSLVAPFITAIPKPPSRDNNPWKGYAVLPLKGARQVQRLAKTIPPLLPHIHQPLLILQGKLDPTVHPVSPQIIFDNVSSPVKELHWFENSTHCVILDKERDLAARLTIDFLQRVLSH